MTLQDVLKNYSGSAAAITRYVGTFASGAAMMVGVLGVSAINPQQVEKLFQAFQDFGTAVSQGLTALSTITGIFLAAYGAWKASRTQQVKSVSKIPDVQVHVNAAPESQAPEPVKALVADPKAPDVVPMTGGPVPSRF